MILATGMFGAIFGAVSAVRGKGWSEALVTGCVVGVFAFLARFLGGESNSEPPWERDVDALERRVE
jgi:hypothetical protein